MVSPRPSKVHTCAPQPDPTFGEPTPPLWLTPPPPPLPLPLLPLHAPRPLTSTNKQVIQTTRHWTPGTLCGYASSSWSDPKRNASSVQVLLLLMVLMLVLLLLPLVLMLMLALALVLMRCWC